MLSSATGEVLWEWNDLFEEDKYFDVARQYQHNEHLAFKQGTRFYVLDLSNGTTLQKKDESYDAGGMSGMDETFFIAGNSLADLSIPFVGSIYSGDINGAKNYLLFTPAYSYEHVSINNITGFVTGITAFRDEQNDVLLAYGFADALPEGGDIYAGVYNYTQRRSVVEKQPLALGVPSYGSGTPIIYENKVYFSPDRSIICLDLYTGRRLWKRDFPEGFTFSGFIVAEGKIIANNEDTYLYALDPETGNQLWKEKSSGTSSKMSHLNGVVYFTGGGDGLLHAVDIETGKHLWRLRSPDLEVNSGAWFKARVSVLPPENEGERGKVIVSSYLSAFCYEAAR